jgi:putative endonuclease
MSTKQTGDRGEAMAAAYLERKGYTILERNYRYEHAEVDLVCFKPAAKDRAGGELIFAEVKTRTGLGYGRPEDAVTEAKQRTLIHAAQAYLYERKLEGAPCRFDVISIVLQRGRPPRIEHFENAFWEG